jgi:hypothetical protein
MPARKIPKAEPPPLDWLDADTVERVRAALRARPFLKERAGAIELVQTHISSVYLTPKYVFKFKRPLDVGFADFRALRDRLRFCRAELRLNRRLAPAVYLDVAALRAVDGGYSLGPRGRVVDYAVVMRRLPAQRMLNARLLAGTVRPGEIAALADVLAGFHRRLRPDPRHAHYGDLETWTRNWEENFAQTRPAIGAVLSAAVHRGLHGAVFAFMERYGPLFDARVRGGWVRNGHGDLRCEHILLARPPRVIDCVEFAERFRHGDVANDVAFLLMDLCAFGYPGLAARLLARYQERLGDRAALPLIPFYCCYRAYVRGKVLGMRLQDRNLPPAARRAVEERARAFFALAAAFARQMGPPVLLLVGGLMGTGKSHLAQALAARTGLPVLASDRIRKELAAGPGGAVRDRSGFAGGIYTPEWTERTYAALFGAARGALAEGAGAILDATFARREHRERAFALAREAGAEPFLVECAAPDDLTLARLRARERAGTSLSDGRAELYPRQKAAFEPIAELPPGRRLIAPTERPVEALAAAVLAAPGLRIPEPLFNLPPGSASKG